MANRAQLSQERSRQRRDQLLAAALEVFLEGGSRAVTHRAVSARAGLPAATTTYYFESIDALLHEALRGMFDMWAHTMQENASQAGPASIEEVLEYLVDDVAVRASDRARDELSVYLKAAAHPALADLAEASTTNFIDYVCAHIARTDVADPQSLAAGITLLINGSSVQQASTARTPEEVRSELLTAMRQLTASHLMGPAAVDEALSGRSDASR